MDPDDDYVSTTSTNPDTEGKHCCGIDCLSNDVLEKVFTFIRQSELRQSIALVSKRWNTAAQSPILWTSLKIEGPHIAMEVLEDEIAKHPMLQEIALTSMKEPDLRECCEYLATNCPNLRTIHVSNCYNLRTNTLHGLLHLNIRQFYYHVTPENTECHLFFRTFSLRTLCTKWKNLSRIVLSEPSGTDWDLHIGALQMDAIAEANLPLVEFQAQWGPMMPAIDDECFKKFVLSVKDTLEILRFTFSRLISDESTKVLRLCSSLRTLQLNFSYSPITFKELAPISGCTKLQFLELIGSKQQDPIRLLEPLENLRRLTLGRFRPRRLLNGLETKLQDVFTLGSLKHLSTIQILDLPVTDKVLDQMAGYASDIRNLTIVCCEETTDDGIRNLLSKQQNIQKLFLAGFSKSPITGRFFLGFKHPPRCLNFIVVGDAKQVQIESMAASADAAIGLPPERIYNPHHRLTVFHLQASPPTEREVILHTDLE